MYAEGMWADTTQTKHALGMTEMNTLRMMVWKSRLDRIWNQDMRTECVNI